MIEKVRLKNWRSHEDSDFTFTRGTNALLGIIGSGKSSVLDAICFCLFGTFPNLQARKIKLDDILMRKPVEKIRGEVEVCFTENGKNYSVKRIIEKGRGTTHSEVRENGRVVESPNTSRVNELIEKILKINYDLFSKAIYSEQNSLDYFLTIPKGQRMKKIDELLMIDRFEKARMNSVSLKNKLLERRNSKQAIVESANISETESRMSDLEDSLRKMEEEETRMSSRRNELVLQVRNIEAEINESRKIKSQLETIRQDEKGISALIENLDQSIREIGENIEGKDIESAEKGLREAVRSLINMENVFRDERNGYMKIQEQATKSRTETEIMKREKIDRMEEDLRKKLEMKDALKKYKLTPENLEIKIDEEKKLVEKFLAEMEVMRMKIKDLHSIIEELNDIESKCPLCDSKITDEKKATLMSKKRFEIDKMKEKFAKAGEKRDISKSEVEKFESMATELEEILKNIKDIDDIRTELKRSKNIYAVLVEQSESFEKELGNMKAHIEKIEKEISNARENKESLESILTKTRDQKEKMSKLHELTTRRLEIASFLKNLEESLIGKEDEELERKWKEIVTEEKSISGRINGIVEIAIEKRSRLKEMKDRIDFVRKEVEEVRKLDKLVEEVKIFEKSLEMTQMQLRKEFVESVNYTMNELWDKLYPYQDFTGVRLSVENGDYVLQLQEGPEKWVNVEGFASGGERSIAALTLRMAFALVLAPQLKWLVLDEPTANMDVKAVEDLSVALSEHIGDFIDQTFLITHDENLEKAVTGYAYRLDRDKANQGATKVVQI